MSLSEEQIERYSRQIILKEIGGVGQSRLLGSKVFILGAGGLGSPVALYLAAAGIGHLVVADGDMIELSNLQRQILHTSERIGQSKAVSAKQTVQALNPEVQVTVVRERINRENVTDLIRSCDLVLDGSDNFPTRYLLNETCHKLGKRLISGAVLGFEGQVATFNSGVDPTAPCYHCLFPSPPEFAPTCSSAGVLGAAVGMVGTLQAAEAVKCLLGIGQNLDGSLLLINLLDNIFHRVSIPKRSDCPTCSPPR